MRDLAAKSYPELLEGAIGAANRQQATALFQEMVKRSMREGPHSRSKAEAIQRGNIARFAGFYGHEIRERVERMFGCAHPVGHADVQGS